MWKKYSDFDSLLEIVRHDIRSTRLLLAIAAAPAALASTQFRLILEKPLSLDVELATITAIFAIASILLFSICWFIYSVFIERALILKMKFDYRWLVVFDKHNNIAAYIGVFGVIFCVFQYIFILYWISQLVRAQ